MEQTPLNPDERERYTRQIKIDGWGSAGQQRLRQAHVGVAGAGGLGAPASLYLATAGVGKITICDNQTVELSNLNRQILFGTNDIGGAKAALAARRLKRLNPNTSIRPIERRISDETVDEIFCGCDLIVDCLDNFEARYVLNRFSVSNEVPLLHGGVRDRYGELLLTRPPLTACLQCYLHVVVDRDEIVPVSGALAGVIGSMQANAVIRHLIDIEDDQAGQLQSIDLAAMRIDSTPIAKWSQCPACGGIKSE